MDNCAFLGKEMKSLLRYRLFSNVSLGENIGWKNGLLRSCVFDLIIVAQLPQNA